MSGVQSLGSIYEDDLAIESLEDRWKFAQQQIQNANEELKKADEEQKREDDKLKREDDELKRVDDELKSANDELKRADEMAFEIIKQLSKNGPPNPDYLKNILVVKENTRAEKREIYDRIKSINERIKSINESKKSINERIKSINESKKFQNQQKDDLMKIINQLNIEINIHRTIRKQLPLTKSCSSEKIHKKFSSSSTSESNRSPMSKVNDFKCEEIADTYFLDLTEIQESYPDGKIDEKSSKFTRTFEEIIVDSKLHLDNVQIVAISEGNEFMETEMRIAQLQRTGICPENYLFIDLNKNNDQSPKSIREFRVPMLNGEVCGKADVAIMKISESASPSEWTIPVIIELKTYVSVNKDQSKNQGLYELIGITAKSDSPVLYVQTDMKTFHLMRIGERLEESTNKIPILYYRCEFEKAVELIQKWITFVDKADDQDADISSGLSLSFKQICQNVDIIKSRFYQLIMPLPLRNSISHEIKSSLKREDIERALEKESVIITTSSRNGLVYKIKIGDKFYAVKVPKKKKKKPIIERELEKEIVIYKRLSYLKTKLELNDDECPWPKLCYHGPLILPQNSNVKGPILSIVTTFIDGQRPPIESKSKLERQQPSRAVKDASYQRAQYWEQVGHNIIKECEMALRRLNRLGIKHGDTRIPNFIWDPENKRAFIIDFGLGKINPNKLKYEGLSN